MIEIVPYDPAWLDTFHELGRAIRRGLEGTALRIDHVGSTAVVDLDAKPIIDIQISVAELHPVAPYTHALERLGYVWRVDNPDKTKRYFRESPGQPRIHIHVRRCGSWSEQFALLFRDYLRSDAVYRRRYSELKRELAIRHADDRAHYTEAKAPFIWEVMRAASDWSQRVGWEPGPSDA